MLNWKMYVTDSSDQDVYTASCVIAAKLISQQTGFSYKKDRPLTRTEILFHDSVKAKGSQPKDICNVSQVLLLKRDLEVLQNHVSAAQLQDSSSSVIEELILNIAEENQQAIDQMVS